MLAAPQAGVGRIDTDYCDAAAGGHRGEPVPETPSRDTRDGAPQPLPTLPAAQCFASGGAGIGEIEVLHRDCAAVVVHGKVEQRGNRGSNPPIAARSG
ncbi:hypothetical protein MLAC_12020 [Mycobacterium lacus]|uniref:Uncharacterized protein n=1 Tax=Mycobacterium lacus TaxID=169765 RepID=A0A7I7NHJ3_9MYCO|nr:hypothetical protein MLAC_12020 [Mycobacterium lacus]